MTRAIQQGLRSASLRRDLGPAAWCALECLVESSTDGHTADTSVRAVAAELGVAKNTAHRAIAALTRAGLITAEQHRDGTGKFRPGRYRLHLERLLSNDTATPARRPRRRPAPAAAQLSLLPGD